MRSDHSLIVGAVDVDVAEGSATGPDARSRLLRHPLHGLFSQVERVVPGHQNLDAVHELVIASRIRANHAALFDEVAIDSELIKRGPVLEVPVEAIGLLDEDDAHLGAVPFQIVQHPRESAPARLLRGLDVHEFLCNEDIPGVGVLADKALLCRDAKPLLFLVSTTETCVKNGANGGVAGRQALMFFIRMSLYSALFRLTLPRGDSAA